MLTDHIRNDLDLAALVRHRAKHGEIPEEQLQQERHITDDFNIAGGKDAQHEILRQPHDAKDETKECRGENAEKGNDERVHDADVIDIEIGRTSNLVIEHPGAECRVDLEAGCLEKETETDRFVLLAEVGDRIVDDPPQAENNSRRAEGTGKTGFWNGCRSEVS